ncbi:alpha/beta-hydrolase [Tothia fuscella]|uniref:Alpha/beta-hydrolase n=1 Tax=Tothia fuscella TaxID=1048955 RepID=A0A9P4NED4_9PEZI|nr:alpha/beta-hydrolase [Tothia fuscella]
MPLESDLKLSSPKFSRDAIPDATAKLNEHLIKMMDGMPKWYEVGAERYRQMRWNNETPLPRPPVLEAGMDSTIASRGTGRTIPLRAFLPPGGKEKSKGTFLHIHGGGWVLQSERYQDGLLDFMAQKAGLSVVSVGYRLAPEDPFPAGVQDCQDAADYLVKNAEKEFGAPLSFMGGESAGAHLTVLTLLYLHTAHPTFSLTGGLALHFGAYDLSSFLPSVMNFKKPLIINNEIMTAYQNAFLPNTTIEQRKDPSISPLYADWNTIAEEMKEKTGKGLPRALFTIGTEDPLLDDSLCMCLKWLGAGGEGILRVYSGAPHGFIGFDEKLLVSAGEGMKDLETFLLHCLAEAGK